VRVAAYGPQAANVVGLTDQTDLFFTMTDALGVKR
jgi:alkaline phosphatase